MKNIYSLLTLCTLIYTQVDASQPGKWPRKQPQELPKYQSIAKQVHEATTVPINQNLNYSLWKAIHNDDIKTVRCLLQPHTRQGDERLIKGIPDMHGPLAERFLVNAISRDRDNDILKLLLDAHADPNLHPGDFGRTPLWSAIEANWLAPKNNIEKVKLLIEAGADVNYKTKYGRTPLEHAADRDLGPIVLLLLRNGAQPTKHFWRLIRNNPYILNIVKKYNQEVAARPQAIAQALPTAGWQDVSSIIAAYAAEPIIEIPAAVHEDHNNCRVS